MVLYIRVGVFGLLCHQDSSTDTTGHDDGCWYCHMDSLTVTYFFNFMSDRFMVLICSLYVK